jgi:hypothetical protein
MELPPDGGNNPLLTPPDKNSITLLCFLVYLSQSGGKSASGGIANIGQ